MQLKSIWGIWDRNNIGARRWELLKECARDSFLSNLDGGLVGLLYVLQHKGGVNI